MMTMTSCIVGKKTGALGPDSLELFPFVIFACKIYIFHKKFIYLLFDFDQIYYTLAPLCTAGVF